METKSKGINPISRPHILKVKALRIKGKAKDNKLEYLWSPKLDYWTLVRSFSAPVTIGMPCCINLAVF